MTWTYTMLFIPLKSLKRNVQLEEKYPIEYDPDISFSSTMNYGKNKESIL